MVTDDAHLAASYSQHRNLSRPALNRREVAVCLAVVLGWVVVLSLLVSLYAARQGWAVTRSEQIRTALLAAEVLSGLVFLLFADRVAMLLVLLYQRHAPREVRLRCKGMPSCSEYAIMALVRYRLPKALRLIYRRLDLCNHSRGAFVDFP